MTSTLELPPRKLKSDKQALTILRSQTSAEILVQMGFPKNRVEKALAATGDKGIQLASDWLLAHVNDPKLDDDTPRDYILYLCPVGQLHQKFLNFWQSSYQECGWNNALSYFPHMTLSSFFQADDRLVSHLSHVLKMVTEKIEDPPEKMDFDVFTSNKYIGLFARENHETFLKNVTSKFAEEMKKAGIEVEVHKKQLHISMAYHFAVEKKDKLDALLSEIDLNTPARWDLRIYSRKITKPIRTGDIWNLIYADGIVLTVAIIYPYSNTAASDELDLNPGDYLFVKGSDLESSDDGWCEGVSWMTGCSGMFPIIYTERTAETETWTMHMCVNVYNKYIPTQFWTVFWLFQNKFLDRSGSGISSRINIEARGCHLFQAARMGARPAASALPLFVAKHGESIESTFGRDWIDNSFDQSGIYTRYDLNMPKLMPTRSSGHQEFKKDSPLTVQGCFQARLLGEALRDKRIRPVHIYTSPALKCIESAVYLLEGCQTSSSSLNNTLTIKVEPGLFDWLGFYPGGLPKFMSFDELVSNGYRVDDSHVTVVPTNKLMCEETVDHFYERCYVVTKELLKRHENEGGIILFISHGGNLDSCTRKLIGQSKRSLSGFQEISRKVPYGAVCVVQEATVVLDTWYLIEPPVLPFAHSNNPKYNWTSLTIPSLI
ncbi:hypothetical protein HELRODRAFT_62030 [Helobdella robusta]|uniref:Protein UBASH3A homolog n=1 Tax=Helobdella robusta TaxID=6412 RepID=T1FWU3_HELRO|nr:hypothetical protein HELRODRAFT_62030 [Helobdella robusta]ESO12152.1 hypothetical protein HELRODRAFT_62030 [Helobdella robusta]